MNSRFHFHTATEDERIYGRPREEKLFIQEMNGFPCWKCKNWMWHLWEPLRPCYDGKIPGSYEDEVTYRKSGSFKCCHICEMELCYFQK